MKRFLGILAMTVGLLGCAWTQAHAAPAGPFCFSLDPFADKFVFFFDSNGGNQFIGTGRDLTTGVAMSATVFITGSTAVLSFLAMTPPFGGHAFMGTVNISLATGIGSGRCESVNSTAGCGVNTGIDLTPIICPPGAITGAELQGEPTGPLMDGSK